MTYFKLRFKVLGGHTHVRLFSSKNQDGTYGKNGDLVFRNEEWQAFVVQISTGVGALTIVEEEG